MSSDLDYETTLSDAADSSIRLRHLGSSTKAPTDDDDAEEVAKTRLDLQHDSASTLLPVTRVVNVRILLALLSVCSIVCIPMLLSSWTGLHRRYRSESPGGRGGHSAEVSWRQFWLVRLALNLIGYATIFVPLLLLAAYLKKIRYDERVDSGLFTRVIRLLIFGSPEANLAGPSTNGAGLHRQASCLSQWLSSPPGTPGHYLLLVACCSGLQVSYLTWGVLQERIMTRDYDGERFHDSQFLVFANRVLAFLLACLILLLPPLVGPRSSPHRGPIAQYAYASLSNILSSWCQYEALKFVSFPTQALAKASKIIPVMLMGRLVSRKTYELHEYGTAALISAGVALFLITNSESKHTGAVTTFSGVFLLVGYMLFDSFTSNWQDKLFKRYGMSSLQMMAGVTMWSCLFTVSSQLEQGSLSEAIAFLTNHPRFAADLATISVCTAVGQLFIFGTIARFGAVIFVIMMTLRQAIAILLSCLVYGHPVSPLSGLGVVLVFVALFLRILINQTTRKKTSVPAAPVSDGNVAKAAEDDTFSVRVMPASHTQNGGKPASL